MITQRSGVISCLAGYKYTAGETRDVVPFGGGNDVAEEQR